MKKVSNGSKEEFDFSNCKTEKDVMRVLYAQEELQIPTGIKRKTRKFFMKVRDFVVKDQISWGRYTIDENNEAQLIESWNKFEWDSFMDIGGCPMFHNKSENEDGFDICFDGGTGFEMFSYYADFPSENGEALSRMAKECGLYYEPRNCWSGNVWED